MTDKGKDKCAYPATGAAMPTLPFVCDRCHVQQHADGICANCGSWRLRPQSAATGAGKGEPRWCAYQEHVMGGWQPAAFPWKFERVCGECGFVEKSSAETTTEFRPATPPATVAEVEPGVASALGMNAPTPAPVPCPKCGQPTWRQVKRLITWFSCGRCLYRENVLTEEVDGTVEAAQGDGDCAIGCGCPDDPWREPSTTATSEAAREAAHEIVGTVFQNTAASYETLEATMIQRITGYLMLHLPDTGEVDRLRKAIKIRDTFISGDEAATGLSEIARFLDPHFTGREGRAMTWREIIEHIGEVNCEKEEAQEALSTARAERLEIQRALASTVLEDPTEDDNPPYTTSEIVHGITSLDQRRRAALKRAAGARDTAIRDAVDQVKSLFRRDGDPADHRDYNNGVEDSWSIVESLMDKKEGEDGG
jgi:hypothetical protein